MVADTRARPILYPYQRRYLADTAKYKAGMWSRQVGKTFIATLEAVLDVLDAEASGRIARWTILSVSQARAHDAIENGAKLHLRAFRSAFEALDLPMAADELAHMVKLPGGSYIRAVAAKPATARGMSDNLILDEFAHHQDNRAIWTALLPVVSSPQLKVRVISTPNGVGDKFHEIMTGEPSLFSRHTVTIQDAVADGLPRDIDELRSAMGDADAWSQEFECQFLDRSSRAWLSHELIAAAQTEAAGDPAGYAGGPCWVGMDIAARGDLTVIAVLEEVGDVLVCRELVTMARTSFAAQLAELGRVLRQYRVIRAAIDQTGMGEMPVEEARRRHGSYRIEGVLFSATRKLDMAVALRDRLEQRRLRLPLGTALVDDLRAVKSEVGTAGIPRLVAERTGGSHADRFWALALAVAAAGDNRAIDLSAWRSAGAMPSARLVHSETTGNGWGTVRGSSHGY